MEKCTFCVQRIRRAEREAKSDGRTVQDGEFQPACAQACPTNTLVFGNLKDESGKAAQMAADDRHYRMLENLGTDPAVIYLKKVDPHYEGTADTHWLVVTLSTTTSRLQAPRKRCGTVSRH